MKRETSVAFAEAESPKAPSKRSPRENPSGSFLLRVWKENREVEGEPPSVRVFLRNLKTGEEHYLGELDQLGDAVLKQFQQVDESSSSKPHKGS